MKYRREENDHFFAEYWINSYMIPLSLKHIKAIRMNKNISKYWEFGELKVLVLDTKSNMTYKYDTNFFIIIRHYKCED